MGEIADAILNGDMDMETGEWIGNGQGFPRTSSGKYPAQSKKRRKNKAKKKRSLVSGKFQILKNEIWNDESRNLSVSFEKGTVFDCRERNDGAFSVNACIDAKKNKFAGFKFSKEDFFKSFEEVK